MVGIYVDSFILHLKMRMGVYVMKKEMFETHQHRNLNCVEHSKLTE